MPESDVTIEVIYKRVSTVSFPATVTVNDGENAVYADTEVLEGTTLTLVITPETGYKVDTIIVTKESGGTVEVTNNTFVMPDENVTIDVTYVAE